MDKALEIALTLVIVGTTLAFGGVQRFTYSVMEVVLFASVLLLLLKQTRQGKISLYLPIWPALFVFWVGIQVVPLPAALVMHVVPARILNGGTDAVKQTWITLSIYPHATLLAETKVLAYLSAFMLAAYLFDYRKRKSILLETLVFLGIFEAAYGIVQYLTGWQKIFTYTKVYYTEEASGTYINHNHFAGLLELTMPFVLASIFYSFQIWSDSRLHGSPQANSVGAGSPGFRLLFYVFLMVIMIVAMIFSRSRGGILAAAFSIVATAVLAQLKSRRRSWMLGLVLFLGLAVCYGLWVGLGPVLARFEEIGNPNYLELEGRISIWKDALGLIRDYPITGVGLGAFELGFRHYQTKLLGFFIDHAHNDYVELIAETGLVGAALLFLPILYLLVRMVISFLQDSRRYRPAIILGCIGGLVALLVHSATDFNLQVPANALILATVLGIGYKAAFIERRNERQPERRRAPEPASKAARVRTLSH